MLLIVHIIQDCFTVLPELFYQVGCGLGGGRGNGLSKNKPSPAPRLRNMGGGRGEWEGRGRGGALIAINNQQMLQINY